MILQQPFAIGGATGIFYSPETVQTGQVPTTQTDFPILINVTDNRFKTIGNGGHVQSSSGFDIRPYSDSGLTTALTYELERYTASTGELIMWVKRSSLADGNITYLRYGDPTLTTDGSDGANTFSNNFFAVWHLKDGTTLSLTDSSGNGRTLTAQGSPVATAASGKIDGGVSCLSANSQYLDVAGAGLGTNPTAVTLSAWVNATSFPNAYNTVLGWDRNAPSIQAMIWVKSTGKMTFFVVASGLVGYDGTGSHTLSTSTATHLALTYSSAAGLVGYVNAASDGTAAANGALATNATPAFRIGSDNATAGRFWNGTLDECRIASVVRSADWITTEYNNQSAPGTFMVLGTEVAL